ncbi:NAD(P)/FAD-dependent oxidoreductase [Francisella sp. 19X1-34]|uniref:NAD(P)/FAD-dependent oxidoreductase n=1 Tax=Francisella sp. 19X1-34 TaxID=3087177 RepID=UPI002E348B8C|nr:NAD(P)/FAD-dependent oxidoreductase [Francisella sp. 19X1-34]MED7789645.1 NAD(P)/FAD-dependent oxidoreductase [Francisella sp. 19X1-34]
MEKYSEYLIIGAGVSGLAIGKTLSSINKKFLIIEQSDKIGGVWNSTKYDGLGSHTPSYFYRYLSFPWKNNGKFKHNNYNPLDLHSEQPSRNDIIDYLDEYSESMIDRIIFNSKVTKVVYDELTKEFTTYFEKADNNEIQSICKSKYLIITVGNKFNAGEKKVPKIVSDKNSNTQIFHSSDFYDLKKIKENIGDKKIVVIGTGKSSQDLLIGLFKNDIKNVSVLYHKPLYSMYYEALDKIDSLKLKFAVLLKLIFGWNKLTRIFIRKLTDEVMVNAFDKSIDPDNWNLGFIKKRHVSILQSFKSYKISKVNDHKILNNQLIIGNKKFDVDILVYATGFKGLSNDTLFPIYKKNNGKLKPFRIQNLYCATMCLELNNLFVPCGRSGLPSSVQSEIDAMWIASISNINEVEINNKYVTPFPYNFDPRSMVKKLLVYKKFGNKISKDIINAKVFSFSLNSGGSMYNFFKKNRCNILLKVTSEIDNKIL